MNSDYSYAASDLRKWLKEYGHLLGVVDKAGMEDVLTNLDVQHRDWLEERVFDGTISGEGEFEVMEKQNRLRMGDVL